MTSLFSRSGAVIVAILIAAAAECMLLPTSVHADVGAAAQTGNSFAVHNVRVFDGGKVIPHANVVVRDGQIAAIGADVSMPDDVTVYEGTGKTLLPGLIDAHVHTFDLAAHPEGAGRTV